MNERSTLAQKVYHELEKRKFKISVAESCTGGLISDSFVSVPGISSVFIEGIVTYENSSKINRLGVSPETLKNFGAVSKETVSEMLTGLKTEVAIAVSGIAGPSGGTTQKPVGTVIVGTRILNNMTINKHHFTGARDEIRLTATVASLEQLLNHL